jgi:hypothetical protein
LAAGNFISWLVGRHPEGQMSLHGLEFAIIMQEGVFVGDAESTFIPVCGTAIGGQCTVLISVDRDFDRHATNQ